MADRIRHDVTGLILAGGRGTRMGGVDKGLLEYGGRLMVQHVIERLQPQVRDVIISANRNFDRYAALGARVVADRDDGHGSYLGPLAGMLAGLRAATTPWVACVPCDAPQVPLDLVARLALGIGRARAAFARSHDGAQPVFCLLRSDLAESLAHTLHDGKCKTELWLRAVGAVEVGFEDASAFANFNSPDDLNRDTKER